MHKRRPPHPIQRNKQLIIRFVTVASERHKQYPWRLIHQSCGRLKQMRSFVRRNDNINCFAQWQCMASSSCTTVRCARNINCGLHSSKDAAGITFLLFFGGYCRPRCTSGGYVPNVTNENNWMHRRLRAKQGRLHIEAMAVAKWREINSVDLLPSTLAPARCATFLCRIKCANCCYKLN